MFSSEQGMNMAVTVFNPFDPSTFGGINPSFGKIRFTKWLWWLEEGHVESFPQKLESHECSLEEFGLVGSESKFWPIND